MQLTLGKHTTQLWGEWMPKGLPAQAFQGTGAISIKDTWEESRMLVNTGSK